jgi:hypothetical protein
MGNGVMPNGLSYRAHPRLYPSVTARAHTAFPKLGADAAIHLVMVKRGPRGLIYCAASRIGACPFKKRRTRSIVRCLSSPAPSMGTS